MSRFEYKAAADGPWQLLREAVDEDDGFCDDDCYIVRGWSLYELLGVLNGKPDGRGIEAMFPRRGEPSDVSDELAEILSQEDEGTQNKLSWVTAAELKQLSEEWDKILVNAGDNPVTAAVSLRQRLFIAEKLLEPPNAAVAVRMVYWFT